MDSEGALYVRFHHKFITSLLAGEKTTTVRYDFSRDLSPGDVVSLVDDDDNHFGIARINRVSKMTIGEFVDADPTGHQSYEHVADCVDSLKKYYPDAPLDSSSVLTVISFVDVSPLPDDTLYREQDLEEMLSNLEEQLSQENMAGATREMIVEATFQRLRDQLLNTPQISEGMVSINGGS